MTAVHVERNEGLILPDAIRRLDQLVASGDRYVNIEGLEGRGSPNEEPRPIAGAPLTDREWLVAQMNLFGGYAGAQATFKLESSK